MTKETLLSLQEHREYIRELRDDLENLRQLAGSLPSSLASRPDLSETDVSISILDLEAEIKQEIESYLTKQKEAISEIMSLPSKGERGVLFHRYILGESWKTIQRKLNYSRRHVFRLHQSALKRWH